MAAARGGKKGIWLVSSNHRQSDPLVKGRLYKDAALFYALRPPLSELWYLSAYEFCMYWSLEQVRYPCTPQMAEEAKIEPDKYLAMLTEKGAAKLRRRGSGEEERFVGGVDYLIKDPTPCQDYFVYPDDERTRQIRNDWVIRRRLRPVDPQFYCAQMHRKSLQDKDHGAQILLANFQPFTLWKQSKTKHIGV